jgi:Dyp-type peroxidase family
VLPLDDIQGNVLRGYRLPEVAYVFLHVHDAAAGRSLLGALAPAVTTARPWDPDRPPRATLNVALTANGLRALGVDQEILERLPAEYLAGMASRADRLGDTGDSAPEHWDCGYRRGEAHILVVLYDENQQALARRVARLSRGPLAVVADERATRRELGHYREHFGYSDGIAQPALEGQPLAPRPGEGVAVARGGWRALKAGEFILGQEDEHGGVAIPPLLRNGTFMVFRKLAQDVVGFRKAVTALADQQFGGDAALVFAKLLGRWSDGTPLVRSPQQPDPERVQDDQWRNDFRYAHDPAGHACPLGAHIRRANPRDALVGGAPRTTRHRIIRRGMPYGPVLPANPAQADVEAPRGLMFVAFNASIVRQFETVNDWLQEGNSFRLGPERDVVAGTDVRRTGHMVIHGDPPVFFPSHDPFVTTRGGEYLLLPSPAVLEALAA